MSFNLEGSQSKKQRNSEGSDDESEHGCFGSIEFVRVEEIDGIELARVNEIGEEELRPLIYGSVVVSDTSGDDIVYNRHILEPECKGPGDYLPLSGPRRAIRAGSWFHICVTLWVTWRDRATATRITKEIANGEITWNPFLDGDSIGEPVENIVRGKHGSVTVGFSIVQKAFIATVKVVMTIASSAQICGTIKAFRSLGSSGESSSESRMLFDKSAEEWVQVDPRQSIPLTRPAVFPVPVDSYLGIEVNLRNRTRDLIAQDTLTFTPKLGMPSKNIVGPYGTYLQVQVSFTFY